MNEIILRTWFAIKEMPLFLRLLAIISPAGILMILGCLVTLGGYGVNGRIVTYGEFWRSGGAFIGITGGLVLTAIGIGLFKRRKWTRHLLLAVVLAQDILAIATVGGTQKNEILGGIISLVLVNVLTVWYVFFKKSVKSYFNSETNVQQAGGAA